MFAELHAEFAAALFDPARNFADSGDALGVEQHRTRFNVYRNNVAVSLIDALAARFPVTMRIVGESFFKKMAHAYACAAPPASPLMMFYGDGLPDFIASFEPARELIYLADIARLEAAFTRAYHAEDAAPLPPDWLQALDAETLGALRLTLHPSIEIICSPHPIVTIYTMHMESSEPGEIADWRAEDALLVRPALDVDIRRLPAGGAAFLHALGLGDPLLAAAEKAAGLHPDFDLGLNLAGLVSANLVISHLPLSGNTP